MAIHFEGRSLELLPGETVLQGLERHGCDVPSFCRQGLCQSCLMRAKSGLVPERAQRGLKDGLRLQSLFLACVCCPTGDLELERHGSSQSFDSRVQRVEPLTENVLRVFLSSPAGFAARPGQYLQLLRPSDAELRAYSIASLPGAELELHVALLPGGVMSGWLRGAAGESVSLRGPFGECFHLPEELDRPLCLAGNGTGLAPLLGVVRAALAAGHRAPIRLYHGSPRREGLYLWAELEELVRRAPLLRVVGSILGGAAREGRTLEGAARFGAAAGSEGRCEIRAAALDAAVLADTAPASEERVYLCGNPELVRKLQKQLYLAGIPLSRIHADAFVAPGVRA